MTNKFSPLDPMAMWRELTAQWEKTTNEFANETMASDPFRQGMHGGMNASLTAQKALGELMARYLTMLNLPTRADLQALGEQLQRIDDHLARIARAVEGGPASSAAAAPGPRRTRQPPKAAPAEPAAAPATPRRTRKPPAGKRQA
ncbi:poly(R)-hydroxyalkanoic acid synthase subunit PhaE [Variovorax sp. V15]|uniref:poly(R)-hydroxyalkanoic acid synthase subunit PhaE n=1 Tax=Variovorax sp. V15 TaxID=3065952 RepID=UPI0034E8F7B7